MVSLPCPVCPLAISTGFLGDTRLRKRPGTFVFFLETQGWNDGNDVRDTTPKSVTRGRSHMPDRRVFRVNPIGCDASQPQRRADRPRDLSTGAVGPTYIDAYPFPSDIGSSIEPDRESAFVVPNLLGDLC